jgi:hypothetical protein
MIEICLAHFGCAAARQALRIAGMEVTQQDGARNNRAGH